MALTVNVQTAEDTTTPSENHHNKYKRDQQIVGAILIHSSEERDVWRLMKGRDIQELNNTFLDKRVMGGDEDTVRGEIINRYPAAPAGMTRVTVRAHYKFNDDYELGHRSGLSRGGYGLVECEGYLAFHNTPIARVNTLDALREASLTHGSIMITSDSEYAITRSEDVSGYVSDKEFIRLMRKNQFTASKRGDMWRIRYNPKHHNRKVAKAQYEKEMTEYNYLTNGLPRDVLKCLLTPLRPSRWTNLPGVEDKDLQEATRIIGDHIGGCPEIYHVQRCLLLMKKMFGARYRGYREFDDFKLALRDSARFVGGLNKKYGQYKDKQKAYRAYRKEHPDMSASDVWSGLYMSFQRAWLLQFLETECRACGIKIPKLPPEPENPLTKKSKKKGKKKHANQRKRA